MSNNKMRIHKGDTVKVISGKDKGAQSVVMRAIPESRKVVVEKVAVAKKAQRPTRDNPQGGIMQHREAHPRVHGNVGLPQVQPAHPHWPEGHRRQKGTHLQEVRKGNRLAMTARLKEKYRSQIIPQLEQDLGIKNINQVPGLEKIVVNMGVGAATQDSKQMDAAVADLRAITGQQPKICRAKKSIANFKLRTGMAIGAKVTLRGERMWEFLDRLLSTAIPRIRDFRGIPITSFDGRGNYSLGITEQLIFTEIDYDKVDKTRGMDITFVTTTNDDAQALALLTALGFPFKKN